jgi:hypothetical protein
VKTVKVNHAIERLGAGSCVLAMLFACGGSSDSIGPPAEPAVPPLESIDFALLGTGKIAFERFGPAGGSYRTFYVVDAGARTSTHILDNPESQRFGPSISPNGRSLAFIRFNRTSDFDLYVADIAGSDTLQVTHFSGSEGAPSWTADGARVIVAARVADPHYNVISQSAVANASDQSQLTHFTAGQGGLLECPFIESYEVRVSISSQGMLAFACNTEEIDVLRADGTLSSFYRPPRMDRTHLPTLFAAEWSPDGSKVAFIEATSNLETGGQVLGFAVKVMSADALNVTTLASFSLSTGSVIFVSNYATQISVCWMPDAARLVFTVPERSAMGADDAAVGHVWVVRADGSALTRLTSSADTFDSSVSCSRN